MKFFAVLLCLKDQRWRQTVKVRMSIWSAFCRWNFTVDNFFTKYLRLTVIYRLILVALRHSQDVNTCVRRVSYVVLLKIYFRALEFMQVFLAEVVRGEKDLAVAAGKVFFFIISATFHVNKGRKWLITSLQLFHWLTFVYSRVNLVVCQLPNNVNDQSEQRYYYK